MHAGLGCGSTGESPVANNTPEAPGSRTVISDPGAACPEFVPGDALKVCTASYLSGAQADSAAAIAFAPDGRVVYAGKIAQNNFAKTPVELDGGGDGAVVRLTSDGRQVDSVTRLGSMVTDMQVHVASGNIAVTGDFGVVLLDPEAKSIVWKKSVGSANRVSVANDGAVAVLAGKHVSVMDAAGDLLGEFDVGGSVVSDVAIDSETKNVFVVGFKQDDGAPCTQLQIPFLRAYRFDGGLSWKAYDWNRTEVGSVNECADSRGLAVAMGADGMLYYAGESHGGNTVHRRQPQAIEMMAPVKKFDKYNDPYNLNGAAPITFYARFKPADGTLELGQYLVTRLPNDKGNPARPNSIAADEHGNILLAGATACCIENAANKTVNGLPAFGAYAGGGFVLVASSDFSQRLLWTSLNGPTGEGTTGVAVATGGGRMAVAITQTLKDKLTTAAPLLSFDAVQPNPGGGNSDGFFAIWRGP